MRQNCGGNRAVYLHASSSIAAFPVTSGKCFYGDPAFGSIAKSLLNIFSGSYWAFNSCNRS
jgi:hypothetical protein